MSSVTKLILAWTMYVTPTVHPTAWITPCFYCQIQQVKSQEVNLSSGEGKKKSACCGSPRFMYEHIVFLVDTHQQWEKIIHWCMDAPKILVTVLCSCDFKMATKFDGGGTTSIQLHPWLQQCNNFNCYSFNSMPIMCNKLKPQIQTMAQVMPRISLAACGHVVLLFLTHNFYSS